MRPAIIAATTILCAGAFALGRAWPRRVAAPAPVAAAAPDRSDGAAAVASAPEVGALRRTVRERVARRPRAPRGVDHVEVQGRRVDPAFLEALRTDPLAANLTRTKVIAMMEARRRRHLAELAACLDPSLVAPTTVRLMVQVQARGTTLWIGDPVDLDVTTGRPVTEDERDCLMAVLSEPDDVTATDGERFASTYDGALDYAMAVPPRTE